MNYELCANWTFSKELGIREFANQRNHAVSLPGHAMSQANHLSLVRGESVFAL